MSFRKSSFLQDPMEATGSFTGTFEGEVTTSETIIVNSESGSRIDLVRTPAVTTGLLGEIRIFNGDTEVGRLEFKSPGTTDAGAFELWTRAGGGPFSKRLSVSSGGAIIARKTLSVLENLLMGPSQFQTLIPQTDNMLLCSGFVGTINIQNNDTNIYRISANVLGTDDDFQLVSGQLEFSTDVNLYRDQANVLKTDDTFMVGNVLAVTGSLIHAGTAAGFFATASAPQPIVTGSRSGSVSLEGLLNGLASMGLIVDATTA